MWPWPLPMITIVQTLSLVAMTRVPAVALLRSSKNLLFNIFFGVLLSLFLVACVLTEPCRILAPQGSHNVPMRPLPVTPSHTLFVTLFLPCLVQLHDTPDQLVLDFSEPSNPRCIFHYQVVDIPAFRSTCIQKSHCRRSLCR